MDDEDERPNGTALAGVTCLVLAGGLGTRLRDAVPDRPKVLAKVQGRPFLEYVLDQLSAAGIRHVVLCIGYRGDQVRLRFGDDYRGMRLAYSDEPSPAGTAGALRNAARTLPGKPLLVMNGDSYCDLDLEGFWGFCTARAASGALATVYRSDADRFGRVEMDQSGRVLRFAEKTEEESPAWINAGVYIFSPELILAIPDAPQVSLEREMLPAWIGRDVYAFRSPGRLLDIGTAESYAAAEGFFADLGRRSLA